MSTGGHTPDVHLSIQGMVLHSDTVAEQRAAREVAGGIDRQDPVLHTQPAVGGHESIDKRAFPCPGITGDPDPNRPTRHSRQHVQSSRAIRVLILQQGDQRRYSPDVPGLELLGKSNGRSGPILDLRARNCHGTRSYVTSVWYTRDNREERGRFNTPSICRAAATTSRSSTSTEAPEAFKA